MYRTPALLEVLRRLSGGQEAYARQIAQSAGLHDQTTGKILASLVAQGLATVDGRGRKRWYRLSPAGEDLAETWLSRDGASVGRWQRVALVVRGVQWQGNNLASLRELCGEALLEDPLRLKTPQGTKPVPLRWWIVEGEGDVFWMVTPEGFRQRYVPVE